jgi:GTP cyclohydrolase II
LSDAINAARAIDALRRGWPVAIDGAISLLAVETADAASLARFDAAKRADILISAGRAETLKLANQLEAATPDAPVLVARAPWIDQAGAMAIADPALDLAMPMKGPFRALPCPARSAAGAALILARHAGLLPAFYLKAGTADALAAVNSDDIMRNARSSPFAHPNRRRIMSRF